MSQRHTNDGDGEAGPGIAKPGHTDGDEAWSLAPELHLPVDVLHLGLGGLGPAHAAGLGQTPLELLPFRLGLGPGRRRRLGPPGRLHLGRRAGKVGLQLGQGGHEDPGRGGQAQIHGGHPHVQRNDAGEELVLDDLMHVSDAAVRHDLVDVDAGPRRPKGHDAHAKVECACCHRLARMAAAAAMRHCHFGTVKES